jgi:DNA-binding NarL/FixJ family response regulator
MIATPEARAASDASISVLIADDHPIFRAGLKKLLEAAGGFRVLGDADSGLAATTLARELQPDLLLLDLAMPGMDGLDVLRQVADAQLDVRVVVLTASITPAEVTSALRLGARGVLMKTAATELLYKCLHAVAAGQFWVGRDMVGSLIEALASAHATWNEGARPFGLTARERQVVKLVSEGCTNRDIAARMHISEDTVKHHLSRVFDKTGTSSRVELALFAYHHSLMS